MNRDQITYTNLSGLNTDAVCPWDYEKNLSAQDLNCTKILPQHCEPTEKVEREFFTIDLDYNEKDSHDTTGARDFY
jgi:hypothetical protein